MRKIVDDVRLMTKVCDLYYNQDVSQQQIASLLGLSRPTVSRLLSSARDRGIVQISVSNLNLIKYWEMERKLETMYGLREVLIVDSVEDPEEQKDLLGMAAGQYVENTIRDGNVVGLSMGSTLYQVVAHINHPAAENVTFVPLIGGMGQLRMDLHANNLAETLAYIYDGTFVPLHAPARVSGEKIREQFMKEESLAEALRFAKKLDMALVGIGWPYDEQSSIMATGYFKDNEKESLRERDAVGDICMQFYNIEGDTSPFQKDNNVIGIDIHRLRDVPYSIGVAGGLDKLAAILGAVRGRYINILITDIACARRLACEDAPHDLKEVTDHE